MQHRLSIFIIDIQTPPPLFPAHIFCPKSPISCVPPHITPYLYVKLCFIFIPIFNFFLALKKSVRGQPLDADRRGCVFLFFGEYFYSTQNVQNLLGEGGTRWCMFTIYKITMISYSSLLKMHISWLFTLIFFLLFLNVAVVKLLMGTPIKSQCHF